MFERHNDRVYDWLREARMIDPEQLEDVRREQLATGRAIAEVALERGLVQRADLLEQLARMLGWAHVAEVPALLCAETVGLIDAAQAQRYGVVPVRADEAGVELLAVDPFDHTVVDDLTFALGRDVRLVVADPVEVQALLRQHYGRERTTLEGWRRDLMEQAESAAAVEQLSPEAIEELAGQPPVVRFVNLVLGQAVRERASDVHFEPFEREFTIRYRVDGALHEMAPAPATLALPITSRLKVLANLNIAERRLPQDGRIRIGLGGRTVDLRISTLPTQFGESVVLRVLDQTAVQLELSQLGMPPAVLDGVREIVRRPNGIFIVTGPTGSGKTTTLYSGLREINSVDLKILTAEDPVEYEIEGLMQVPVNPAIGLTFASALRSFLRQDPDVIMVGEIRDLETAQIAIQAALTGHLVLTTLHTNDAAGAVTRLVDLGVEPFLIANTVEAVLAQRLVRRICPHCLVADAPAAAVLAQLGIDADEQQGRGFSRGGGCAHCGGTGYRGRRGLFEWMRMSDTLRDLVVARAAASAVRETARREGMRTLREEGLAAIRAGETTVDEVLRCT